MLMVAFERYRHCHDHCGNRASHVQQSIYAGLVQLNSMNHCMGQCAIYAVHHKESHLLTSAICELTLLHFVSVSTCCLFVWCVA